MNGYLFVSPVQETKQVGGIDLISKLDEEDRYCKAVVKFTDPNLPLKENDMILYDKNNGHQYQYQDELLTVLRVVDVVGVI